MSTYEATIGLEIHAELRTATKMFCRSRNDPYASEANVHICPVCMAHPGTLPVINTEAVRHVLRLGVALGSTLADYTEFDRKNYFYPDLPKGYQLSQFEYPLVSGGFLKDVQITRVHLEEDTASSIHDEATGETLIDYNRAGVPLMELVTEPVIKSAEQAGAFARELQILLRYLGASEANMEKGEMRVEANVSVARPGERSAAYVEIKNLNSFKAMERAVAYEIKRQESMLERGEAIIKQTLGWDENKQATFPQRTKEGSADYRYFPDPDLPSLKISEIAGFDHESLRDTLPELPEARRARYLALGIKADDADLYVRESIFGSFFDEVTKVCGPDQILLASNYIANDLVKIRRDTAERDSETQPVMPISVQHFVSVIDLVSKKKISSRSAKDVLTQTISGKEDPMQIVEREGLMISQDTGAIEQAVDKVIADNPSVVADIRAGKATGIEFLLGQCMKALRGSGDPATLRELLKRKMGT